MDGNANYGSYHIYFNFIYAKESEVTDMESTRVFNCNMELTLDIIGGKWKPLIIFHIGNSKKLRYGEINRLIPDISQRVLSRGLKELEQTGIISREEFKEKILRVEYSLTEIGNEVSPLLNALTQWGNKYNSLHKYAKIICE